MAAASRYSSRRMAARTSACACPCGRHHRLPVKKLMLHRGLRFAACALATAWLCACGLNGPFTHQRQAAQPEPERTSQDLSPIAPLLEMMGRRPLGDPARQAELLQSAKDADVLTPTTRNRL